MGSPSAVPTWSHDSMHEPPLTARPQQPPDVSTSARTARTTGRVSVASSGAPPVPVATAPAGTMLSYVSELYFAFRKRGAHGTGKSGVTVRV